MGRGHLRDGNRLEVVYILYEYEEPLTGVPGLRQISGIISCTKSLPVRGQYVLHLDDGRKLRILLDSGDGQVRALGGFF
jgi:hypothetical protein